MAGEKQIHILILAWLRSFSFYVFFFIKASEIINETFFFLIKTPT